MLSHLSLHNSGKYFFNTANDSGICAQTLTPVQVLY